MRIKSKIASLVWKALIVIVGLVGIVLSSGITQGALDVTAFQMFTTLSNIVVVVYFFVALVVLGGRESGKPTFCPLVKQIVTMGVIVTFLVAHFLLGGCFNADGSMAGDLLILHYIVPIMTLVDWLAFDEKGRMPLWGPFAWMLLPVVYFIAVEVAVNGYGIAVGSPNVPDTSGGMYPYPFLNAASLGWPRVIGTICLIFAVFVALGYLWRAIDKLLARFGKD